MPTNMKPLQLVEKAESATNHGLTPRPAKRWSDVVFFLRVLDRMPMPVD